jgi:hypothetical protein
MLQSARQEFVGKNTSSILKPEQTVIGEHGAYTHQMGMQYPFVTEG